MESPEGQQHAQHTASRRQQQAFTEELPDQAQAAGAQGGAQGDLFLPSGGPGQEEIGDIGAGDQQDKGDRSHQN